MPELSPTAPCPRAIARHAWSVVPSSRRFSLVGVSLPFLAEPSWQPAAVMLPLRGVKEMIKPCLICLHAISLVPDDDIKEMVNPV